MTNVPDTQATDGVPTYLGRGDRAGRFANYYPAWVDGHDTKHDRADGADFARDVDAFLTDQARSATDTLERRFS
jgi:hypothetical protein